MKTVVVGLITFFSFIGMGFQDPSQYLEVMQKNIQLLFEAQTAEDLQVTVNAFERIAQSEKDKWHPLYYTSLGYVMMSTRVEDPDVKDEYLDYARERLKEAMKIEPKESELVALEGFIYMIRTSIDPASRGQQYSGLAMLALGKAVAMDPENPRALYLQARMQLGTARFFGSDISDACTLLDQAIYCFDRFEPTHPLDPSWGKRDAIAVKQQCE